MAQSVTLNGSSFSIPDVGENDWGQNVTDFLVAIPGAVLQKSGGSFTLTAEVDFGGSFGLKSLYYKSRAANPASAGAIRLGVADVVSWRNNANGANLDLGVDAADALIFGSNKVITVAGGFTSVGTNSYANQKGIRFMEQTGNGTNYIEVVAPDAVTANVTLKLPDGAGSSGQVLSTDGAGVLSWINASGGGTINTGTQGRLAIYASTGTTLDDVVTLTNTISMVIATHGQASVYTIPDTGQATANFVMTQGAQTIAGAKTFSGATVISNASTAAFTVSNGNAFKVDSTNIYVSIGTATMAHPLYVSRAIVGGSMNVIFENSDGTNAASDAMLSIVTGGASSGDPYINWYNGITNWSMGIDNSASDALVISNSSSLGTSGYLSLGSSAIIAAVDVFSQRASAGGNVNVVVSNTDNSNAASHAFLITRTGGGSAGDPYINWNVSGATNWSMGMDNSDSDCLVITEASSIGGANNRLRMPTGGQFQGTDGSAAAPTWSFINAVQTGAYLSGTNIYSVALAGVKRLTLDGTEMSWVNASSHAYFRLDRGNTSSEGLVLFATAGTTSCGIGLDNDATSNLQFFTNANLGTPKMTLFASGGLNIGAPTGGDKGAGTLNTAADIYKNNSAYSNPDYALEHWATGKVERFINNPGAAQYPGILPLVELENHMRTNYDLPGVKERFRDADGGQGIFARADVALEKIEEAFIYVVQIHNRQNDLEKRVEALEQKAA